MEISQNEQEEPLKVEIEISERKLPGPWSLTAYVAYSKPNEYLVCNGGIGMKLFTPEFTKEFNLLGSKP